MHSLNLTADLSGCPSGHAALTGLESLRTLCRQAVARAGLQAVGECFHAFPAEQGEPRGVTGVILLAESHLAVHTWPELCRVTIDLHVCHRHTDNSARARAAMDALIEGFAAASVERHELQRGLPAGTAGTADVTGVKGPA